MQVYIKLVGVNPGIPLKGRHIFDYPKVVQDLLRHASYQNTAKIYDLAVSDEKREAHSAPAP